MLLVLMFFQLVYSLFFGVYNDLINLTLKIDTQKITSRDSFAADISHEIYLPKDIYMIDVNNEESYFLGLANQREAGQALYGFTLDKKGRVARHSIYEMDEAYMLDGITKYVPFCNAFLESCLVFEASDTDHEDYNGLRHGLNLINYHYKTGEFEVLVDLENKKYTKNGYSNNNYFITFKDGSAIGVNKDDFKVTKNFVVKNPIDKIAKDLLVPENLEAKYLRDGGEGFSVAYYKTQIYRDGVMVLEYDSGTSQAQFEGYKDDKYYFIIDGYKLVTK